MEGTGGQVVYPTVEQICDANRRILLQSGGRYGDNLLNPGSLEYILGAITGPLFGTDRYPTLKEKAAALGFQINKRHIFIDGNKRTGIETSFRFLEANGIEIQGDDTIVELSVAIAKGDAGLPDLLRWLHAHQDEHEAD